MSRTLEMEDLNCNKNQSDLGLIIGAMRVMATDNRRQMHNLHGLLAHQIHHADSLDPQKPRCERNELYIHDMTCTGRERPIPDEYAGFGTTFSCVEEILTATGGRPRDSGASAAWSLPAGAVPGACCRPGQLQRRHDRHSAGPRLRAPNS